MLKLLTSLLLGVILLIIVGLEVICVVDTCIRIEACIINEENLFYNSVNATNSNQPPPTARGQTSSPSNEAAGNRMVNSTTVIIRNESETNGKHDSTVLTTNIHLNSPSNS